MGKKYIMSPHDDVRNFLHNAIGMTMHKWSRGKRRIDPVFKSHKQRKAFKAATILERANIRAQIAAAAHAGPGADPRVIRLRAVNKMNKMAQPRTALRSFGSDNRTRPKIYVQGHGEPGNVDGGGGHFGRDHIWDDANNTKTVRQTSTTLKRMGMPARSIIRTNSCFSATSVEHSQPLANATFGGGGNMDALSGPAHQTFAGNLAHAIRNTGRKFPNIDLGGYPGETTQMHTPAARSTLVLSPFPTMATLFRPPPGAAVPTLAVKRGDTRRDF